MRKRKKKEKGFWSRIVVLIFIRCIFRSKGVVL